MNRKEKKYLVSDLFPAELQRFAECSNCSHSLRFETPNLSMNAAYDTEKASESRIPLNGRKSLIKSYSRCALGHLQGTRGKHT